MWQQEGFLKDKVDTANAMRRLAYYIKSVPERYKVFSAEKLLKKPAPGKWSKQEILGHLIDSAVNNLKRFGEAQYIPSPYIVVSYKQDELVKINNYQNLDLEHLLDLWQALNRQIINLVENIPAEKLDFAVDPGYDNNTPRTLGWIICDYVAHMEHHFGQVFPEWVFSDIS